MADLANINALTKRHSGLTLSPAPTAPGVSPKILHVLWLACRVQFRLYKFLGDSRSGDKAKSNPDHYY
jgi:hypothetical protein